jgi:RNA polymerase sigma-70 factor, ECF subfamily
VPRGDQRDDQPGDALARARARWPRIGVEGRRFAAFLAERGLEASELADERLGDLYLACACAAGDGAAIAELERHYLSLVPSYLAPLRRSPVLVDETLQRLRERLFIAADGARPRIEEYSGRGALGAWLRVIAVRLLLDACTPSALAARSGPLDDVELATTADPELGYMKTRYLPYFQDAFSAALSTLTARERGLLRFHLVDGLNIAEIGKIYGTHRATVARWIAACRERLLEETRRALGERLRLSAPEVESMIRLLRSSLDVSIRGYLVDEGPG